MPHIRALLLTLLLALAMAPAAFAVDNCPPDCGDPEPDPDPITQPIADIAGPATAVRTADTVTFSAAATDPGAIGEDVASITKVEWDLDGSTGYEHDTGTALTKDIVFPKGAALGERTVRVRVTTTAGVDTDFTKLTIQNRQPTINLAVDDDTPVTGQQVAFHLGATDHDSAWFDHAWKFGGVWCGSPSGCGFVVHNTVYTTPGTHTQTVGAEDADGGWSETSRTITVRPAPVAALTVPEVALNGETVTLDASASTGSGERTYRWDVDGNAGNGFEVDGGKNPKLTTSWTTSGEHPVRVRVTDDGGATVDSTTKHVRTHASPTADFSYAPADPIAGQEVAFTATAADDDGIDAIAWDLDGDAGNGFEHGQSQGAKRTFATPGAYTVRLRVEDGRGAETIVTKTVTVKAKPVVEDPKKEEPKDDKPADGGTKDDRPATGGNAPAAVPGAPGTSTGPAAAPSQQRVAQPAPAVKKAAKKKAKKRCAAPKGKKARGKKAKKRCGKAKKARRAKKRK